MSIWITALSTTAAGTTVVSIGGAFVWRIVRKPVLNAITREATNAMMTLAEKVERRFDKNDADTVEAKNGLADLKLDLAKQFGGNGGGIRQAINELQVDMAGLKGQLNPSPAALPQTVQVNVPNPNSVTT